MDTYDAKPEKSPWPKGGVHHVTFVVEAPRDLPQRFTTTLSREKYDELAEHSDTEAIQLTEMGAVPVVYENGWKIAWEELEGYSYG